MNVLSHCADIATPTGIMRTYIHRPVPTGLYPAVLFYSEIFQQTSPIERAAKIIASHGYAVLVPEIFHELNPIGTVLGYDDAGRIKGNQDKTQKDVQSYDSDNLSMIAFAKAQDWCNGHIGAMGFCIGGHLAFRAALQAEVKSAACFYATDLGTRLIPCAEGQHSMEQLANIHGELLMIWGRQDPYVPDAARATIHHALSQANCLFTWHEFNAKHAFMRDEDERYDAESATIAYQLALGLFRRTLHR